MSELEIEHKKSLVRIAQNITRGGIIKYTTKMISKGFSNKLLLNNKMPSDYELGSKMVTPLKLRNTFPEGLTLVGRCIICRF
jgi:hypothetical protein